MNIYHIVVDFQKILGGRYHFGFHTFISKLVAGCTYHTRMFLNLIVLFRLFFFICRVLSSEHYQAPENLLCGSFILGCGACRRPLLLTLSLLQGAASLQTLSCCDASRHYLTRLFFPTRSFLFLLLVNKTSVLFLLLLSAKDLRGTRMHNCMARISQVHI